MNKAFFFTFIVYVLGATEVDMVEVVTPLPMSHRKQEGFASAYIPYKTGPPECHVEYQVTERVPGNCIELSGNVPACQTREHVAINYKECAKKYNPTPLQLVTPRNK